MTGEDQVLARILDTWCRHVSSQETDGGDLRPVFGLQDLLQCLLAT